MWAAFAVYLAIALLVFINAWVAPGERRIGSDGDAQALIWTLAWVPHALAHGQSIFYTDHLNYPAGLNLMWTYQPLPALLVSPITVLWGPTVAYNVLTTAALPLSGIAAFAAIRRFTDSDPGAFLGGLFYGFSPYMFAHSTGQTALTLAVVPPLLLLCGHEMFICQRVRPARVALGLALLAVAQLLTFLELLATEAVAAFIGVVILVVLRRGGSLRRARYVGAVLARAVPIFAVLAAYPLYNLLAGPQHLGTALVRDPTQFSADLMGFVLPGPLQAIKTPGASRVVASFTGNAAEWASYLGVPLLLAVVFNIRHLWASLPGRWALLFGGTLALISLGPRLHVAGHITPIPAPEALLRFVPVVGAVMPARFALFQDLALAILIALIVARVACLPAEQPRRLVAMTLGAVVLLSLIPGRYPAGANAVPAFFDANGARLVPEGGLVVTAPFTDSALTVDPMSWQAASGFRFRIPGVYGFLPSSKGVVMGPAPSTTLSAVSAVESGLAPSRLDAGVRALIRDDLVRWGAVAVVVGPMPHREDEVDLFTQVLARPPLLTGGVAYWSAPWR